VKNLLLAVALLLPAAGLAQEDSIENVIRDQLQSFNERDVAGAWVHASPMIKGMFGTPENFAKMVENGYPMVWDNADVQFLDRTEFESLTRQEVQIQGPDGLFYILDYQMIETRDGWQINGVYVIPAPEAYS
jgi:hypothetical protein